MKVDLNPNNVIEFLKAELKSENSFIPETANIPLKLSKGIYFWFMKPEGYKALSSYIEVIPLENSFSILIDDLSYDLVYLGTAGTGKNGRSNLTERLSWHIGQKHSSAAIISGTISTFRKGLGSLLSNDLIEGNTEFLVNEFMKDYLKVFYVEYSLNINQIYNDEIILLKSLKPILNLNHNPNALKSSIDNTTLRYKDRRQKVDKSTIFRLKNN
ncbi:hypothetical protein EOJ36_08635 [Sandaracinomonas limnophila]|uniref:GIY-YIG catalytic domain-containing protein n=1 Tax=Sandaracinomonas limnophila TaxID=1862386 RepID=A0A437PS29_9BACT|nr:hypothetical protein [Sandaracinomonas limnophila]RVU25061.1 hypothetical protein EOJ36_08635 [Sandaracinomonas limnophila]